MTKDMCLGVLLLIFSAFYIVEASRIRASALGDSVGAGGVPTILGWVMAITAAILVAHQLWLRRLGTVKAAAVSEAFETPLRTMGVAAGVLAMAGLYIAALRWLGYIPATVLLLCGMLLYQGARLSFRVVLVSLLGAFVLWLLFDALLGIALPDGMLAGIL